jgi:hypothetical protein
VVTEEMAKAGALCLLDYEPAYWSDRDMVIDIYRAMELRRRHGGVGSSLALGEC